MLKVKPRVKPRPRNPSARAPRKSPRRWIYLGLFLLLGFGLMTAIATPCFVGSPERAMLASLKANMYGLQTAVETYAIDHQGRYPSSLQDVKADSAKSQAPYWTEYKNPITAKQGLGLSYAEAGAQPVEGLMVYEFQKPNGYRIFAYKSADEKLKSGAQDFVLQSEEPETAEALSSGEAT